MDDEHYLNGKWFHTFKVDGEGHRRVEWQGQILKEIHPDYFAVQLHDWLTGFSSDEIIIHISDMKDGKFVIYKSNEIMNEACYSKLDRSKQNNKEK